MADEDGAADPWGDPVFEQAVRDTAYFLWENAGRPAGREQEFWFQALEVELMRRRSQQDLSRNPD